MATLVLLQRDLREVDNPAMFNAVRLQKPLIVCHIMEKRIGQASKWWLCESLRSLRRQLNEYGVPLLHLPNPSQLTRMIQYLNSILETPIERILSNGLDFNLPDNILNIHEQYMGNFVFPPESMEKEIKVFTPFWKKIRAQNTMIKPLPVPDWTDKNRLDIEFDNFMQLPEISPNNWCHKMEPYWNIGELAAQKRYRAFVDCKMQDYEQLRDRFDHDATSKLSPHLRFGEISARQMFAELGKKKIYERFVNEIGWRDFAYHAYRYHPDMATLELKEKYRNFPPQYQQQYLEAWKSGRTGYPVIDAAMRELWQTGWIHNRLRMLVASFLVKNLLVPWQIGEQWFFDCLVDADPAINPFNWQWVAGCGCDSVPYFRIFNPVLQGEKFDPQALYIRKWLPELANVPVTKTIHQDIVMNRWDMRPKDYPEPIVDLKTSRGLMLATYKTVITSNVEQMKKPRLSK